MKRYLHAKEDIEEIYKGFWFVYRNSGIFLKSDSANITDSIAKKFINTVCDYRSVDENTRQRALNDRATLDYFKRRINKATLEHIDTGKITYWSIKGRGFTDSWPEDKFEDAVTVI